MTQEAKLKQYYSFLESKIIQTPAFGFKVPYASLNPILKEHQKKITRWAIEGGRRAIGASFGLGKTMMQIEIAKHIIKKTAKSFLIGMPLNVADEFYEDAALLGYAVHYVRNMEEVLAIEMANGPQIFLSNYERIREGKFNPDHFGGVSFDEGDAIRNLDTETTDYIMSSFGNVEYRFIATATPSPNDYTEILNYAQFLGIADRSQLLTRFFQRNSTKAGDLTLYPHKEREFWLWVHSWMVVIQKPSDLGCPDDGYILPDMQVNYHMVTVGERGVIVDRRSGQVEAFAEASKGVVEASREKRSSLQSRVEKAIELVQQSPDEHFILWHHLDDEYKLIRKLLPEAKIVHGGQNMNQREEMVQGFKNGDYKYLATKPCINGSGCNFQKHCHRAIFVGINYEFKDFIQAVHRIYRFLQTEQVVIDIIYSDAEEEVLKKLLEKWARHNEMVAKMSDIIREYGLSDTRLIADLKRTIGVKRMEAAGKHWKAIHNDAVLEAMHMEDDSVDMILTSIPFSDQFEYCESYHDMGHNDGNGEFFEQLDFLTPELLRVTKPGRIAAIHVKDRIQFSYQNGVGFTSVIDFSGLTVAHFIKHGWFLLGKHVITTDVVVENNQTYRLGHSEQCKDATKMGCGSPEYLLLFRKAPSDTSNAYADLPVVKSKKDYPLSRWQLDAHAYWRSSGNRLLNPDELRQLDLSQVGKIWQEYITHKLYDFEEHLLVQEALEQNKKLPKTFMAIPPKSPDDVVWDDINRMFTLNSKQRKNKREKHVCPLQFDIVDRAIYRFTNAGEIIYDPFGGVMTVPYRCISFRYKGEYQPRFGIATELNHNYWRDGVKYCQEAEYERSIPTLFDALKEEVADGVH